MSGFTPGGGSDLNQYGIGAGKVQLFWRLVGVAGAFFAAQQAASMDHLMNGKSPAEAFSDPHLAELTQAACSGNSAAITVALSAGANPNGRGSDGTTPLLWAVDCQNAVGVEALLRAGADPNYEWPLHFSPTYLAATRSNNALLESVLRHGGNPNALASNGDTALVGALGLGTLDGHWENYYTLLHNSADINYVDDMGWTIVDNAVVVGHFDKVAELLEMDYRGNLTELGRTIQARLVPWDPVQSEWHKRVKEMLEHRGVSFPVPPLAATGSP